MSLSLEQTHINMSHFTMATDTNIGTRTPFACECVIKAIGMIILQKTTAKYGDLLLAISGRFMIFLLGFFSVNMIFQFNREYDIIFT